MALFNGRSRGRLGLCGLVLAGCFAASCASGPKKPVRTQLPPGPELDGLSPAQELDALLQGVRTVGKAASASRVAVPPFRVLQNKEKQWLGEAAAETVAAGLTHFDGLSVLERGEMAKLIEELKRDEKAEVDASRATRTGKLLGARLMVLGTLIPSGAGFRAIVKPVRVEDGVVLPATEVELDDSNLDTALKPVIEGVAAQLGQSGQAAATVRPLDARRLQLAAKARELQYAGNLVAAQPLYAQALAEPSSAWRLEADYMRLMADLGMFEWVEERATQVLKAMPVAAESMCDRAKLLIQKSRHDYRVEDMREAVRAAASCGDASVQAMALYYYSKALSDVSYPVSRMALERSRKLLGEGNSFPWLRCQIAYEDAATLEGAGHSNESWEKAFAAVGQQCVEARNTRFASYAFDAAGNGAWNPGQRGQYYQRALEQAKLAGGERFDDARLKIASQLRGDGKLAEADDKILEVLGSRLKMIQQLTGALQDPETRLDEELLERSGVKHKAGGAKSLDASGQLLLKIHRTALAKALRAWAERTRPASQRQGDFYAEVADALDPPEPEAVDKAPDALFAYRMKKAGVPLEQILKGERPVRGAEVDLLEAFNTLWNRFFELRGAKAPSEKIREVVKAAGIVAGWLEHPRRSLNAIRLEAFAKAYDGNDEASIGLLRSAAQTTTDSWARQAVLREQANVVVKTDKEKAAQLRGQAIDACKEQSPSLWVTCTSETENALFLTGNADYSDCVARLVNVGAQLEGQGILQEAADAYEAAAELVNRGERADGTPEAVRLMNRRAATLDKLKDPIRSADARIDVLWAVREMLFHTFRGGVSKQIHDDPQAVEIVQGVAKLAEQLAQQKRTRDAVRLVARLDADVEGVGALLDSAFGWAKTFQDSAEYPGLMGALHSCRAQQLEDSGSRAEQLNLAKDFYLKAKMPTAASQAVGSIVRKEYDEARLWTQFELCVDIVKDRPDSVAWCVGALSGSMINHSGRKLHNKEAAQRALRAAREAFGKREPALGPQERNDDLTNIAMVALVAGDLEAFRDAHARVERSYTKETPDPYQWVTHLSRVSGVARHFDIKLAVTLYKQFDSANGASCYWKSGAYLEYARDSFLAGDAEAEALFVERGRACSAPRKLVDYELYLAPVAIARKDWKLAEKTYLKGLEALKKLAPQYTIRQHNLQMQAAVAQALQKKESKVKSTMREAIAQSRKAAAGEPDLIPCMRVKMLEIAASASFASGACQEARALQQDAEKLRARCTEHRCFDVPGMGVSWCDGPTDLRFRATNACNKPFSGNEELF